MIEVFVDCMPIEDTEYLVYKKYKADNTISIIGFDQPDGLAYCGIPDIRDYYVGASHEVYDDEGTAYEIIRLK